MQRDHGARVFAEAARPDLPRVHGSSPVPDEGWRLRSVPRSGPAEPGPGAAPADPDLDLARRAASGDRSAFEQLLRRHYAGLHRLAWRLTGSADEAEDIVQDVCCQLADRISGFRGDAKVTTWLYGIVVNACHDHHRRRATFGRLKSGLSVLAALRAPPDGRELYRRTWLSSALGRLEPVLRETVALVVGEGLTHAEAAAALGVAESTVSWRLHEIRKLMSSTLLEGDK